MNTLARCLALFAVMSSAASGETPAPDDFAFGFSVESEKRGAIWAIDLPDAVYRGVTKGDLGDIRVFNSAGGVIPHVLRLPEVQFEEPPGPVAVPFYALNTRDAQDKQLQSLRIITDEKGAIVDTVSTTSSPELTDYTSAYLLDISALERPPASLKLAWARPGHRDFAANVEIASSDNLSRWSVLEGRVSLADLRSAGGMFVHDEIKLPAHSARYLRITWPEELREVTLTSVVAAFGATRKPPPIRWLRVAGMRNPEDSGVIDYDSGGHWPANTARLRFESSNVVLRAELLSSPGGASDWRNRHRGIFYKLVHEETTLESEPAGFGRTSDRFWRLRLLDEERHSSAPSPVLMLGWMPHVLNFVAEGDPPYTVAFGSAALSRPASPIDDLLRDIDNAQQRRLIVPARPSEIFQLGGEEKLEPPKEPFPWKTLLLWGVLLVGVAMLAWMVTSLYRQMRSGDG